MTWDCRADGCSSPTTRRYCTTECRERDTEAADAGEPELVTDGGSPEISGICEWCGDTTPFAGKRKLYDVSGGSVDAGALCTTCILEDAGGEFADARDDLATDGGQETAPAPGDTIGGLDAANAAAQAGLLLRVQPEAPDPTEYLAIRAGSWAVRKHGQRMWSSLSADEARERVTAALALTERAGGGGVRAADHDDGLTEAERR